MNIFLFSARACQQVRAEKETVPRMLHAHTAIEKKKGFFTIFFFLTPSLKKPQYYNWLINNIL